jgi:ferredoxin, 2Fe-2S
MSRVVYVHADGTERSFDVKAGQSVMTAAVLNGVPGIIGECGGELMCATCHVYVVSPETDGVVSEDEDEMLEFASCPRRNNSRLSCQLVVDPDNEFVVQTPETQN